MKTILDFDYSGKTVIVRCDFNVPIKNGKIIDDTRIKASLRTLNYLLSQKNTKVIVLSHLGKVKSEGDKIKNSLAIVYEHLKKLLDFPVKFCANTDFNKVKEATSFLSSNELLLLENTRFYDLEGNLESDCTNTLAEFYASLGDIFILDAFAVLHRAHASVVGIAKILPTAIGFLVMEELQNLDHLKEPSRPFAVLMGGAKVSDKIKVIESFIEKVDYLLIGGAMAFTFLKALGLSVGKSFYEEEGVSYAKDLLSKYRDKIILPKDFKGFLEEDGQVFAYDKLPSEFIGYDIGPETIIYYQKILQQVKTVFWNGPFGVYENSLYATGTVEIIKSFKGNTNDQFVLLGGGDIVACVNLYNLEQYVSFISTGGGATLKYLTDWTLPGLKEVN